MTFCASRIKKMFDMTRCESTLRPSEYSGLAMPSLEITPPLPEKVIKEILQMSSRQSSTNTEIAKKNKEEKAISKLLRNLPVLSDLFVLHKKIGEGTYSTVYLASYKNSKSQKQFALKHLTDNFSLSRIQKELRFMQMIGGSENVINVLNCLQSSNKDCVVFVMPYLPHRRFSEYVLDMDAEELKLYMKNLFIALRRVHSFNVIHRDVKPGNFLYSRDTKQFLLVDFGLAQELHNYQKGKMSKLEANEENIPINYSKRKRSCNEDLYVPSKRATGMSPLQSRENIIANHSNVKKSNVSRMSGSSLCLKSQNSSKIFSPSSAEPRTQGLDLSLNASSGFGLSSKNLGTSVLQPLNESKMASTPKSSTSDFSKNFKPLVGNVPLDSFVVRNSQVLVGEDSGCVCRGTPSICSKCAVKRPLTAPRAGTPGFRPPEVLLKCLHQTTAVDMWAAGIVLLCVLSGTYPFFKSPSDLAALMELITVFGTEAIKKVAKKWGRNVPSSLFKTPLDLRKVCRRRRARFLNKTTAPPSGKCQHCLQNVRDGDCVCYCGPQPCSNSHKDGDKFPDSAYHLLTRLLDVDPDTRITAEEALSHPFITQV